MISIPFVEVMSLMLVKRAMLSMPLVKKVAISPRQ